ncbi:acid-sensing ion channel 1-like [Haliotis asinina]|uniref:acid-sensing ion channel 1-like n=1 Tax=Haliotis asinina TaxID=109174 RepID=UPI003531B084
MSSPTIRHMRTIAKIKMAAKKPRDGKTHVVGHVFKDYAQRATVHGIPQTVGATKYCGQRFIWLVLLLGLAISLTIVVSVQMTDYYSYPTVINMAERPFDEDDFPAITFCDPPPLSPFSFLDNDDDDNDHVKIFSLLRTGPLAPHGCLHMRGAEEAERGECLLTHSQNSVRMKLIKCGWNKLQSKGVCDEFIYPTTTTEGSCLTLNSSRNSSNSVGQTLTFNIIIELDSSVTSIGQRDGIQIALHSNNEYPFPDVKEAHFIPANSSCIVKFEKTTRHSLGPPYKDMLGGRCLPDQEADQRSLYRYPHYSQKACQRECLVNFTSEQCGCRFYLDRGSEDLCSAGQTWHCLESSGQDFYGNKSTQCNCPSRCTRVEYETFVSCTPLTSIHASAPMVHLTFLQSGPLKMEIEQIPVYSVETILANIGGQIGLFMGFSIVSMVEILEVLAIMVLTLITPKVAQKVGKDKGKAIKEEDGKLEVEGGHDDHNV